MTNLNESEAPAQASPTASESTSHVSEEGFRRVLDAATPRQFVIPVLIVLNVLLFGFMMASGVSAHAPTAENMVRWGGNFGPKTANGEWWRLVTHQFIHAGWFHLAINMYALLTFGLLFEKLVGNVGFLVVYTVSGISGGIARLHWGPYLPSVGASGSIFGIAAALLGFVALRRDSVPASVRQTVLQNVLTFLALNVFHAFKAQNVDHAAHVGGSFAGLVSGMILSQPFPVAARRRAVRNGIVTAMGITIAGLGLAFMPDLVLADQELAEILTAESRILQKYRTLTLERQEGNQSSEQHTKALEEQLTEWSSAKVRTEKLLDVPNINRPLIEKLLAYFRLREEGLELRIKGYKEGRPEFHQKAAEKWKAADAIAESMNSNHRAAKRSDRIPASRVVTAGRGPHLTC